MNAHDSVIALPLAVQYYSSSAVEFRSLGVSMGLAGPDGFGRTTTTRSSSSTSSLKRIGLTTTPITHKQSAAYCSFHAI